MLELIMLSTHEWKTKKQERALGGKVERDIKAAGAVCVEAGRTCGPGIPAASCTNTYTYKSRMIILARVLYIDTHLDAMTIKYTRVLHLMAIKYIIRRVGFTAGFVPNHSCTNKADKPHDYLGRRFSSDPPPATCERSTKASSGSVVEAPKKQK